MFFDETKIYVKGGGRRRWRHRLSPRKVRAFGGPSGGNGGPGGNVYLVVDRGLKHPHLLSKKSPLQGPAGGRGSGKNQQGESGPDLFVPFRRYRGPTTPTAVTRWPTWTRQRRRCPRPRPPRATITAGILDQVGSASPLSAS